MEYQVGHFDLFVDDATTTIRIPRVRWLVRVASEHEKAAGFRSGRFPKMERAKRLELLRQIFDSFNSQCTCESTISTSAAGDALADKSAISSDEIQRDCEEMHDLFEAWRKLEPGMKAGMKSIIYSRRPQCI